MILPRYSIHIVAEAFGEVVGGKSKMWLWIETLPGWFIILGLVASSAMHNQKALVLTISILVPLGAAPFHDMDSFAHTIVPIGAGILLGTALRPAVREWTDHDRTSAQPLHRDQ